ncbi:hypothetical protein K402DRAFT_425841 [Aulographum hederae CBS 113979]|uniref:Uncharacterized protein n=1 Tax=Aulographum hederae CBS 113979 TaxID=1176131 RepID=A0A6G1GJ44_9PEZI|nr:hypothetical protein K402DRAFT_425841 [Aulographum hederae CBS 113979]
MSFFSTRFLPPAMVGVYLSCKKTEAEFLGWINQQAAALSRTPPSSRPPPPPPGLPMAKALRAAIEQREAITACYKKNMPPTADLAGDSPEAHSLRGHCFWADAGNCRVRQWVETLEPEAAAETPDDLPEIKESVVPDTNGQQRHHSYQGHNRPSRLRGGRAG